MNGPAKQEADDRRHLTEAVLDYQRALMSTVSSLTTAPIRPVHIVVDKEGVEASLQPLRAASEEVVRRLATAAGINEQAARLRVRPLLKEVGVLAQMSWQEVPGESVKQTAGSSPEELALRAERLNVAAVEALIRFHLDPREPRDDEPFAETRRAWEAYDSRLARFRRRRRVAAAQRHRRAWERWAAAQGV